MITAVIRVLAVVIGAWQVLGLLPALGWLANPDAVTANMLIIAAMKSLLAAACFGVFVVLGRRERRAQINHAPRSASALREVEGDTNLIGNVPHPPSPDHRKSAMRVNSATSKSRDELHWERAFAELQEGSQRPGLWARAFAEASGDESIAKANYLKWRVEELSAEQKEVEAEEARHRAREQAAAERAAVEACVEQIQKKGYRVEEVSSGSWRISGLRSGETYAYGLERLKEVALACEAEQHGKA